MAAILRSQHRGLLAQDEQASLTNAHGAVLNGTSMASFMPRTAYAITKAVLITMTFGMPANFGANGIRILKLHGTAEDIAKLGSPQKDFFRYKDCFAEATPRSAEVGQFGSGEFALAAYLDLALEVAYRHDQKSSVRDSPTARARHASNVCQSSVRISPMFASDNRGLINFD